MLGCHWSISNLNGMLEPINPFQYSTNNIVILLGVSLKSSLLYLMTQKGGPGCYKFNTQSLGCYMDIIITATKHNPTPSHCDTDIFSFKNIRESKTVTAG